MGKDQVDTIVDKDGHVWTGEVTHREGPGWVELAAEMILGVDAPEPEVTVTVNDEDHTGRSVSK